MDKTKKDARAKLLYYLEARARTATNAEEHQRFMELKSLVEHLPKESESVFSKWLARLVAAVPVFFLMSMIAGYIVEAGPIGELSSVGFDMATISAVLGSLILTGGFIAQRVELRRIGLLYLIATIGFIVLGMSMPLWDRISWAPGVAIATLLLSTTFFAIGTIWLVVNIPQLWRETEQSPTRLMSLLEEEGSPE